MWLCQNPSRIYYSLFICRCLVTFAPPQAAPLVANVSAAQHHTAPINHVSWSLDGSLYASASKGMDCLTYRLAYECVFVNAREHLRVCACVCVRLHLLYVCVSVLAFRRVRCPCLFGCPCVCVCVCVCVLCRVRA